MKILFTGGGSGGHFYPILSVAEELNRIADEKNLIKPELYYVSPDPYDMKALMTQGIEFRHAPAGKVRNYPSILNFIDLFKTAFGTIKAIFLMYSIFPDVVFSKGSYASIPTVLAARLFGIPVVIHDSDAVPGKANMLASKFAHRIALSYPQAVDFFDESLHSKIAVIGNPVRKEIEIPARDGSHNYFDFSQELPTLLVLGGSQGAKIINETIMDALPDLLLHYQIVHQTGREHFREISGMSGIILENNVHKNRYRCYAYLNDIELRMAAGVCNLIISRSGSGTIFETSAWGKASILIPINEQVSRDQRKNAYAFARVGAAVVIEEVNLTPHVLLAEIDRILKDRQLVASMEQAARSLYNPDAATKIAHQLLAIALGHED